MVAFLEDKKRIWNEIKGLTHIGRSPDEIIQTLSSMGYGKAQLKEVLTGSFMDSIMWRDQDLENMLYAADNQERALREKAEQELLEKHDQEELMRKQKTEVEQNRQNDIQTKNTEEEKKTSYLEEQKRNDNYLSNATQMQEQVRQQAEEDDEKKQKDEEQRLRELYAQN